MARQNTSSKNPYKWNPHYYTVSRITQGLDRKKAFIRFRNSSSAYVKKPKVRDYVLSLYENKCCKCGTIENLQIDHIKSVYKCFQEGDFFNCNSLENLQVLCRSCNSSKSPD